MRRRRKVEAAGGGGTPSLREPRNHYLYIVYPTAAIAIRVRDPQLYFVRRVRVAVRRASSTTPGASQTIRRVLQGEKNDVKFAGKFRQQPATGPEPPAPPPPPLSAQ
ncbi:hypothetical protein QTP88_006136 [Uroleucon formosanum]